jgi:hypothetical protein
LAKEAEEEVSPLNRGVFREHIAQFKEMIERVPS